MVDKKTALCYDSKNVNFKVSMIMVKSTTNHNLVRQKRLEKGMSLSDLGALVDLADSHICKIESGERQITARRLYAFASALGVSINDLCVTINQN